MIQELYTEKYRPKTLDHILLPERIRTSLGNGEIHQNLLFYGSPGLGKTSLAKILASPYPYLYINVSDESSVDVIRDKITNFCSTVSVMDGIEKHKIVVLDEMDGASDQFYKALRATIEKFAETSRFVGTCNYINKVPDAVQSRFTCISFDFLNKDEEKEVMLMSIKRVWGILKTSGIEIEKDAVIEFVKRNFPDMRSMVNKIQTFTIQGVKEIKLEDIKTLNYSFHDVFDLIFKGESNPHDNYKYLITNYSNRVDDVLNCLAMELPDYIRENQKEKISKIPQLLIKIAMYQSQRIHVIDPCITMLAAVFDIQMLLNN